MNNENDSSQYVIISPVRDEEAHLEATIASVTCQTIRPVEWVIVDDGSTDKTGSIIDRYASQFPWIRAVHRPNRGFRKSGGGVVEAFYDGYNLLDCDDWDFIVKLDGDLSFDPHYFARIFEHFQSEPRLGMAGGTIYHIVEGKKQIEVNPKFHVRGATKIYRRECWEQIGGLWPAPGWDTIDETKANMLGWTTVTFPDIHVVHHRFTGSADGKWADRVKHGLVCYISGYHPLFVVASCVYRLAQKPYVIGSAGIFYGYISGYLKRVRQVNDRALIKYVRHEQLMRLLGRETIWR